MSVGEGDGGGVDGEVGGIEDEEASVGDDVKVDGDGAGELAAGEVGLEPDVVGFGEGEFGEARLAFELLHFLGLGSSRTRLENYRSLSLQLMRACERTG